MPSCIGAPVYILETMFLIIFQVLASSFAYQGRRMRRDYLIKQSVRNEPLLSSFEIRSENNYIFKKKKYAHG